PCRRTPRRAPPGAQARLGPAGILAAPTASRGLAPEDRACVQALPERGLGAALRQKVAHALVKLVRKRQGAKLTRGLEQADHTGVPELRGFVRSLRLDGAAIRAMLRLPWSNGPTEGHINRLKTLKRQLYGRAGWPRLKRRFLLGP